jgi:hypothetical protein
MEGNNLIALSALSSTNHSSTGRMSIDAILTADHLARHKATYGNPGAYQKDSAETIADHKKSVRTAADDNDSPQVILDPSQNPNIAPKSANHSLDELRRFGHRQRLKIICKATHQPR